ncbi:unnamed protein product [Jaminaea pallidilutea]
MEMARTTQNSQNASQHESNSNEPDPSSNIMSTTEPESTNSQNPTPSFSGPNAPVSIAGMFTLLKAQFPDEPGETLISMAKAQLELNSPRPVVTPSTEATTSTQPAKAENSISSDMLKELKTIPKLKVGTWHAWRIDFAAAIEVMPIAGRILYGDVDRTHREYDEALDKRLISVIRSVTEREGSRNVRHIIDKQVWSGGRELYEALRSELTKGDELIANQIVTKMTQVRMIDNNVERTISDIVRLATEGIQVGVNVSEDLKIAALANCTRYTQTYKHTWNILSTTGRAKEWDHVQLALLSTYNTMKDEPLSREPRAAALSVSTEKVQNRRRASTISTPSASKSTTNDHGPTALPPVGTTGLPEHEGYLIGRKDKNGNVNCFKCGEPRHLAKFCPNKDKAKSESATLAEESAEVADH